MSSGARLLQRHVLTPDHSHSDVLGVVWHIQELPAVSEPDAARWFRSKHQTRSLPVRYGGGYSSGNSCNFTNRLKAAESCAECVLLYRLCEIKFLLRLKHTKNTCPAIAFETSAAETLLYLPPTDIGDVSRWPSEGTPAVSDRVQAKWSQTQVPRSSSLSTEHHQRGGGQGAVQGSAPAHAKGRAIISHVFPDVRNRLRNADGQRQDETRWVKEKGLALVEQEIL